MKREKEKGVKRDRETEENKRRERKRRNATKTQRRERENVHSHETERGERCIEREKDMSDGDVPMSWRCRAMRATASRKGPFSLLRFSSFSRPNSGKENGVIYRISLELLSSNPLLSLSLYLSLSLSSKKPLTRTFVTCCSCNATRIEAIRLSCTCRGPPLHAL